MRLNFSLLVLKNSVKAAAKLQKATGFIEVTEVAEVGVVMTRCGGGDKAGKAKKKKDV